MDIQGFKDEVLELIEKNKLADKFKDGPIYFLVNDVDKNEILMGQFPAADSIPEFFDMTRLITRTTDYVAVAMISMTADLDGLPEEKADEVKHAMKTLEDDKAIDYLRELNVLHRAVTVRFEAKDGEGNSIINCPISDAKESYFGNVMEMEDDEMEQGRGSMLDTFGDSLFNEG